MRQQRLQSGRRSSFILSALVFAGATVPSGAPAKAQAAPQTPSSQPATPTAPSAQSLPTVPNGQIVIESHGEPPAAGSEGAAPTAGAGPAIQQPVVGEGAKADLTDAQRSSLLITGYDLDARLVPARSGLSVRARLTVRNDGSAALKELPLQISSTLHWDSATLVDGSRRTHLALAQHTLDTDTDHTGTENEAILSLPTPLAPGTSVSLDLFYSGTVPRSAQRLARLGASGAQQENADWDAITTDWTGVRGFGQVLWYPVASPQFFLADGNSLFEAVGRTRLREENASIHLRLSVEYNGEAPRAAYFCGRRQALQAVPDDPDAPNAGGAGVATADFPTEPLGFRTPSLFLIKEQESVLQPGASEAAAAAAPNAPSSSHSSSAPDPAPGAPASGEPSFLAVETSDPGVLQGLNAAADRVVPVLREWLGPRPLSALTAIDHPGQPFQDGPLLVAPLSVLQTSPASDPLIESLTPAWVQTGQPWMDQGLAEFFALLWTEREQGQAAANAALTELMRPVALVEPDPAAGAAAGPGQPLIAASDEVFYRRKAAAVWWMLRGLIGDGTLHQALSAWRTQPLSKDSAQDQALAFEHLLERLSGKDLSWFFQDWVLHDRGLPDLSITDLATAPEAAGANHPSGWVVAVTVRNQGGAVADVPVIIRSGNAKPAEQRMRIPALSTVTQRILIQTTPTAVQVNDGSTPEIGDPVHIRDLNVQTQ